MSHARFLVHLKKPLFLLNCIVFNKLLSPSWKTLMGLRGIFFLVVSLMKGFLTAWKSPCSIWHWSEFNADCRQAGWWSDTGTLTLHFRPLLPSLMQGLMWTANESVFFFCYPLGSFALNHFPVTASSGKYLSPFFPLRCPDNTTGREQE